MLLLPISAAALLDLNIILVSSAVASNSFVIKLSRLVLFRDLNSVLSSLSGDSSLMISFNICYLVSSSSICLLIRRRLKF